jgi:pimeloyl-ACP methyl ester carboxylesterase
MEKKAVLGILLFAAVFSAAALAQTNSTPPFPAPGRLVDVGGWRLHLNCTGQAGGSQPTVILEAGIGDFSVEWSLVQPGVAKYARVCSYDRAGDGWSDLGPYPRTMHQLVYELHTLLDKGGVHQPFVLVGHSYGGWLVRLYAYTYPSEISGIVLIDAGASNPWRLQANGKLVRASDLATGRPIPAVLTSNPLKESDVPAAALNQMKAAARSQGPTANDPPRNKLPAAAQRMCVWSLSRWQHFVAGSNPGRE